MNVRKTTPRRVRRLMLGVTALATTVVIGACGSGSATTSSRTTSSTTPAAAGASTTASRTAFQQCLQQHGIAIPQHAPGTGTSTTHTGTPPAGGGVAANPARQAAFKACGATGQHANAG